MAETEKSDVDVVVVGAGFAGLYLLHRLRGLGLSTLAIEAGDDVGGTWYWNRYPGARCDIHSIDYSYSFDTELETEWQWSEKYARQPEILRYLGHVADKHDLRRDIRFGTRVQRAVWDDESALWEVNCGASEGGTESTVSARFFVMATGCLSQPKTPEIDGVNDFEGDVHFTSSWPHEGVDFTGKRVAVIGTGSSGVQSIPIIAEQADHLTIFQRTPNFSVPAHNGPIPADKLEAISGRHAEYREAARWSRGGVPVEPTELLPALMTEDEQLTRMEEAWEAGALFSILNVFADQIVNPVSNEVIADFIRAKIRATVTDPDTADLLCPTNHPFGTKRPCLDSGYYETFNLDHVDLVDLHSSPISAITATGIETSAEATDFDAIVFATGFDAMTGAIVAVDITGRDGVTLADSWAAGPTTYLGLTTVGFPNLFTVTGPGSPSVLSNMVVSIEQHVDWIAQCIDDLGKAGFETIEPTETAQAGWDLHVADCANITLFPQANSWYMGANVPGKPQVFLPYIGGVDGYRHACDEVVAGDYLGFVRRGPDGERSVDGIVRRVQPDVAMVLEFMETLGLPPLESMSPEDARAFMDAASAERPPGPDVGEIVDGTYPGAAGDLDYRLFRPASPGPHPVLVYYHGGGWVLGSADSDEPFCRDLCVRSNSIVISMDYRHAPEARFPAPIDDGLAALRWVAENIGDLGGDPTQIAIGGWSAGANIAAVVAQLARDAGGPDLVGQLLVTPVTNNDLATGSYVENADGYVLTAGLMNWFWDHYADAADRSDPRASPLLAKDLSNLPPAMIVTCEFDPLRDEGNAYAAALADAGVAVTHRPARGHTHTSLSMVDVVLSGAPIRAEMAEALQGFFKSTVAV